MPTLNKYEQWRNCAESLSLNVHERSRVEWMIFYEKDAKRNSTRTCEHFGISKKTFFKWFNRFTKSRNNIESLKNISRKPHVLRNWEISKEQENRIKQLRKKHLHYGKKKLKVLYVKKFNEKISCWKIERVIRKYELYPDKNKQNRMAGTINRTRMKSKRSFTKLERTKNLWFLFQMDTLAIKWGSIKRYILTAVDHHSKLGYARMYKTKNLKVENDFLYRINHMIRQPIADRETGNNTDTSYYFEINCDNFKKKKYFSWVNTPKYSTEIERFIETLEYEWLFDGNLTPDCDKFNKHLVTWLIEYNFNRPHQKLNYLTPTEYINNKSEEARFKKKMSPGHLVETVLEYISKLEIDEIETLSVEKIAAELNIERKRIWRSFKNEKKLTLKEYIFRVKVYHAIFLLKNDHTLTVKQVAEKIGYYSYSYFIHIFKKYYGITPGKYREMDKKKE